MLEQNNFFSGSDLANLLREEPAGTESLDLASILAKLKSESGGEVEMNAINEGGDVEDLDDCEEFRL
jgi:hypothetical protein